MGKRWPTSSSMTPIAATTSWKSMWRRSTRSSLRHAVPGSSTAWSSAGSSRQRAFCLGSSVAEKGARSIQRRRSSSGPGPSTRAPATS
eukprot:5078251-Lingulodinium_polyedra.AAC.1